MAQNRYYSNTAVSTTLSSGINNAVTTMVVGATTGFPGSFPYTLVIAPDTVSEELVKVTAAVGTSLTIVRGQDGTSATSHSAADVVKHVVSAQDFAEPQAHMAANAGVHGLSGGTVVGTTEVQTLTNKTLTAPALSAPTASGSLAGFGGAWGTWTPTWTANGTPVTLAGSSVARYIQIGKIVIAQAYLSTTSVIAAGTDWTVTLPVAARANTSITAIGGGAATVNNAAWFQGEMWIPASNTVAKMWRPASANYLSGAVASGDQWVFTLMYEAA